MLLDEWVGGLASPFDSFLESYIRDSAFYVLEADSGEQAGYYAIHDKERLTQFYMRPAYLMHAQRVFGEVLERHAVASLFVQTGDELLLGMALDRDLTIHKQAYFFQDSGAAIDGEGLPDGETFRPAVMADAVGIRRMCGDFLDAYERRIGDGELFVYERDSMLVGLGIVERSGLLQDAASIGMFASEAFRRQGVGRTVIRELMRWCRANGIRPLSGCWYYNEASKRTLERAGMVTKTRLLHVEVAGGGTGD
ncbi:GNAT family N-acetyltransferase [Paenibacillus xanthanilyticus]|uniref:GNAT family N-acetyltransferase n=1 Tax=Paenibacillus xanthanilyticus TaxID=1783531 RepID=A0ABV8K088_9BACL